MKNNQIVKTCWFHLVFAVAVVCRAVPSAAQPIQRSQAEVRAFRAENPCPATGRRSGPCRGWAVDHVRPLALQALASVRSLGKKQAAQRLNALKTVSNTRR